MKTMFHSHKNMTKKQIIITEQGVVGDKVAVDVDAKGFESEAEMLALFVSCFMQTMETSGNQHSCKDPKCDFKERMLNISAATRQAALMNNPKKVEGAVSLREVDKKLKGTMKK
jgi:hypothetical protein